MLPQSFSPELVVASIVIATLASYAALALSGRVRASSGSARFAWLTGAGLVLGLGITAMHFVGMLAMDLGVPVIHDSGLTISSAVIAIMGSTAALSVAVRRSLRFRHIAAGALFAGGAIAGMHYLGMVAMRGPFVVHYDVGRVLVSVLIAITAAAATLCLAYYGDDNIGIRGTLLRVGSALAMGLAIAGMHYTAMSASVFVAAPAPALIGGHHIIEDRVLAVIVTIVGCVVTAAAILIAVVDRRSKLAARALVSASERYRQIAEALREVVWTATADGLIDYCNQAWFDYSGMPFEETRGWGWTESLHPDDTEKVAERWRLAIATGDPYEMEFRIRRGSDGAYRWHLGRATALRDIDGRIEKWLGTVTDVHDQKTAEDELRDGQRVLEGKVADREAKARAATDLYRLLAENASDMVSTHAPDGSFDYTTPNWSEFTGIAPDKLRGQFPALLCHPDDGPLLMANYRLSFSVDRLLTTVWRCRREDGTYGWLETTTRAVRDPQTRRIQAFVCATRDVTERLRAEAATRESEARYRQLLEHAADAILSADAKGNCVGANARACSLLRRQERELLGLPLRSLFVARDEETAARLSALAVGEVILAEDIGVRGDGTHVPVELSIGMLPGGGMQVIARDITSRKELERLKSEFVSVVSHELRTPLTSIRGALGLLASGRLDSTPATSARMLDLAVTNTDRLIRLINDILDVERIESGAVAMERAWCSATDIAQHVVEALRPVAERAGVTLTVIARPTLAWADADRLTQTLTNLVGNAIKFSPPESTVEIRVSADSRDVRFEVRDAGRGIPTEKFDSIFERFQQVDASDSRAKGGTGLGLSISRSIVRQHGGKIWVESALGQGSTFCLTLPLPPAPRPEPAAPSSETIIICDDDPGFLEVLGEMLEQRGYAVSTATSGLQLIELVKASRPNAIFIDMVMRGLSGRETLEALHGDETTRGIPTIVMSGAMPMQDAHRVGALDWLSKPIDEAALSRALSLVSNPAVIETGRVLVVEDDRALAHVIAATLESHGYAVNVVHSGGDALACYHAVGADIVIVDLGLPDMTGLDVLDWIRAESGTSAIPSIMYTATDLDIITRDRVEDAGAVIAIKSRTSPDALVDLVTRLLQAETRIGSLAAV